MDENNKNLDQETVDSASKQISYYNRIPKHIREKVSTFQSKNDTPKEECKENKLPAHVVSGLITVKDGSLNIPFSEESYEVN